MNYNTCVICLGHPQPDVTVVRLRTAVKTSLTTPLSASRNSGLCQRASKSSIKIIVTVYGNGIGIVQRFDPSHSDLSFDLLEGVRSLSTAQGD